MAKTYATPRIQAGKPVCVTLTAADTTANTDIYTAPADGAILYRLIATNDDDTVTPVISVKLYDGATTNIIGTYTLAQEYGTDGTNNGVNLLEKIGVLDPDKPQIPLISGNKIIVSVGTTITADKSVYITAIVGTF